MQIFWILLLHSSKLLDRWRRKQGIYEFGFYGPISFILGMQI